MKECENCKELHEGFFGSGRFCGLKCSRSFSTRNKRQDINEKIKEKLTLPKIDKICLNCGKEYLARRGKENQKYCSRSCNSANVNKGKKMNGEERKRISEGVKNNYTGGKKVYGGRTKWYTYKNIKVQGTFELRTCIILDKLKENREIYDWDYTEDRITYLENDGSAHTYLLDFKIFTSKKEFYYLETKGYVTEKDLLKWMETRKKYRLDVWFYKEIRNKEKELNLNWERDKWIN
jgi:hypothetical protein